MSKKVASIYAELGIDSKKFTTGLKTASAGLGNFKSGIGGILSAVGGIGLALGVAKVGIEGFKKALEFSKEGASIERLEDSSAMMAKSMGLDMDDIVKAVREASLGTVSDLDIMSSATKALMLGVGTSAEAMGKLMEVAAIRGRAMGLTTTQAFNDIVTGIGRQSKLILDNLGIVLNLDEVYGNYAETLGKTSKQLTNNEKKEAMVQAVIKDTQGLLETTGGLLEDNLTKWEQMKAAETNYWNEVKKSTVGLSSWFGGLVGGEYDSALLELQFKNIKKAAKELGIEIKDITKEMPNFFNPAGPMDLEEAIWRLQTRVALAEGGFTTAEKSMMDYYATLYTVTDGTKDLEQAQLDLKAAQEGVAGVMGFATQALRDYNISAQDKLWLDDQIALATGKMTEKDIALRDVVNNLTAQFADGTINQWEYFAALQAMNEEAITGASVLGVLSDALNNLPREIRTKILIEQFGYKTGTFSGGSVPFSPPGGGYPQMEATGGPAYAGNPYIVGESGPEPFIPEVDGRILSRSDAMLALSEGRGGKGDTYNYNLTMPTTADPAEVGTAFEIMRAYGGR